MFFAISILHPWDKEGQKGGGSPQEANKQTHVWEGQQGETDSFRKKSNNKGGEN